MLLSRDYRVQGLVVAFCFGSLLESMAARRADPVSRAILLASVSDRSESHVALFADAPAPRSAPFGNPIFRLSKATGLPAGRLGDGRRQAPDRRAVRAVRALLVLSRGLRQLCRSRWPPGSASRWDSSRRQLRSRSSFPTCSALLLSGARPDAYCCALVAAPEVLASPADAADAPDDKGEADSQPNSTGLPSVRRRTAVLIGAPCVVIAEQSGGHLGAVVHDPVPLAGRPE